MAVRVMVFCGSSAEQSHTHAVLNEITRVLTARGADVTFWCLREQRLPFADARYHEDPHQHPDATVRRLTAECDEADAFVWGSPVYHHSYSSLLKNCLDNLAIPQFASKPIGLVSHGAERTAVQACDHLRIVARGLFGVAIVPQVITINSDYVRVDNGYQLVNPEIVKRIDRFCQELLVYARLLRTEREARTR